MSIFLSCEDTRTSVDGLIAFKTHKEERTIDRTGNARKCDGQGFLEY